MDSVAQSQSLFLHYTYVYLLLTLYFQVWSCQRTSWQEQKKSRAPHLGFYESIRKNDGTATNPSITIAQTPRGPRHDSNLQLYTVTLTSLDEEALQIELAKTPISPTEYTKVLAESKVFQFAQHWPWQLHSQRKTASISALVEGMGHGATFAKVQQVSLFHLLLSWFLLFLCHPPFSFAFLTSSSGFSSWQSPSSFVWSLEECIH